MAKGDEDSPTQGVQGDHADQHQREYNHGRAALAGAVGPCVDNRGDDDEKRDGEEDSAGLGERKPVPEPSPVASEVASDSRHARSLGEGTTMTMTRPVAPPRMFRMGDVPYAGGRNSNREERALLAVSCPL